MLGIYYWKCRKFEIYYTIFNKPFDIMLKDV